MEIRKLLKMTLKSGESNKGLNQTSTESVPTKIKLEEPQNILAILMEKSKPAISVHKLLMMSLQKKRKDIS